MVTMMAISAVMVFICHSNQRLPDPVLVTHSALLSHYSTHTATLHTLLVSHYTLPHYTLHTQEAEKSLVQLRKEV